MQTITLEVELPREILSFGMSKEQISREVEKWLILSLFRSGRVSSGKAAQLMGISRRDVLELLDAEGIAYFDYSAEELETEFAAVQQVSQAEE
jgi:predicted HTH domain antitoxin